MQRGSEILTPSQSTRLARFNLPESVDIHCHCLPDIDDGPQTMDKSLSLCRALVEDGITAVIATPHQLGRYDLGGGRNAAKAVRAGVAALEAALEAAKIPLAVHAGADVRVDERIPKLLADDEVLTLADGRRYVLLELPRDIFLDPTRLLRTLKTRGICGIISHPERNDFLAARPSRLQGFLQEGALLQVTAGSLCGDFGSTAERSAWEWVAAGWIDLVASDAHNLSKRPPRMSRAIDSIAQQLGEATALRCCVQNPLHVLRGEAVSSPWNRAAP
jgi:protein-tyrosine phosphatase